LASSCKGSKTGSGFWEIELICMKRTKKGERAFKFKTESKKYIELPEGGERKKQSLFVGADALKALKKCDGSLAKIELKECTRGELVLDLLDYEEKFHTSKFKFGVLFACGDQGATEDEMYGNKDGDELFDEFLDILGARITLKGWKKFRGGLNTESDSTGKYSVYTDWRGFEIMFHVSTLLPYMENNPQQIDRKRHLGNDIVVVIFHTGKGVIEPSCFRSQFNHVFIIVRPVPGPDHTRYAVTVVSKAEIPLFKPQFSSDCLFEPDEIFREFILLKLVNAELTCLASRQFEKRQNEVRSKMLIDIIQKNK